MIDEASAVSYQLSFGNYRPRPPLSVFVERLWFYEGCQPLHTLERILPTGTTGLVINLLEDRFRVYDRQHNNRFESFPGALVIGPHSEFFVIDTFQQRAVMGVNFKPGGAFPFFNLPVDELRDLHVALEVLWGRAASDLREQLLAAPTPQAKFEALEQALLAYSARFTASHPAVAFALKEFQNKSKSGSLSEVTGQIGLSSRRFTQLFSQEVGLTPKLFWRVQRFQEAVRLIDGRQNLNWADIALGCGYFDQAHFIHDFQAFSGLNPTAYLNRNSVHANHVPLWD